MIYVIQPVTESGRQVEQVAVSALVYGDETEFVHVSGQTVVFPRYEYEPGSSDVEKFEWSQRFFARSEKFHCADPEWMREIREHWIDSSQIAIVRSDVEQ